MDGHDSLLSHWCAGQLRLHALLVMEWRKSGISINMMASRLGKSESMVKKMKAGTSPISPKTFDQFVSILGLDPVRMFFSAFVLEDVKAYYSPIVAEKLVTTMQIFGPILEDAALSDGSWTPPQPNTSFTGD